MEMLLCYEDEGVYVNTYGRIIKDVVLQWGEMPTSVGGGLIQKQIIINKSGWCYVLKLSGCTNLSADIGIRSHFPFWLLTVDINW